MRILRNLSISLLALAMVSSATVVTYTSRATWEAASSGITNVDLESLGLATNGYADYGTASGLTTGGLSFVGVLDPSTYYLWAYHPPTGNDQDYESQTILRGPEYRTTSYLRITLPTATTAFGLELMTVFPGAQNFRILLDGTDIGFAVTTASRPTRTFFGFTSTTAVSELRIALDSGTVNTTQGIFDNFAYGAGEPPPGETPEVATLLGVGSGLVMMRWIRRRTPAAAPIAA
jgi:hypothetical protein